MTTDTHKSNQAGGLTMTSLFCSKASNKNHIGKTALTFSLTAVPSAPASRNGIHEGYQDQPLGGDQANFDITF